MKDQGYYEQYWDHEAHMQDGWTPSDGAISPDEKKLFELYLKSGVTCLDYGCGDGSRYGHTLEQKGVNYCGFDISAMALKQAAQLKLNVQALQPDGRTTMPENTADVAICFEVLEHLMEPQNAVDELHRCLKTGGTALMSVPNAAFWTQRVEFLLTGFWNPGGSPITARKSPWCDPHIRFYEPRTFKRLIESAGFKKVSVVGEAFSLGSLPVIWRKPGIRRLFDLISLPISWLGKVFPGLFSARLFIVVQK